MSPDPDAALIERQLRAAGSPQRAASEQNYLKSKLEFAGTTVPQARAIVTAWRRAHPELTRQRLTEVAAALWDGPIFECQLAAVLLLTDRRALLHADDAALVERMLRTAGTWALLDGLAADVMGNLVERFGDQLHPALDRWATDGDFWVRRSALLALLVPLRRGDPANFPRFAGYADAMLEEREFFVRKAIGWVLRETGKRQPGMVADWLAPRAHRASGVTMREAVKWLPASQRDSLMAAYQAGHRTRAN
ncbi:MAG TPA: DNA alkylation repair protein [Streptosporangiaceae bacterium]|nr:DNA alkylation repair protein [Streptosporangiaceae bacterium]